MDPTRQRLFFEFFNEIGIISQLSRARAERQLPDDLTMSHFTVLNHLTRVRDGQTPLDMARAFQIPKTTLTNTLAGLEKRAMIEMRPNPKDGRSKCVWLTSKGSDFLATSIASIAPGFASLSTVLNADEMQDMIPTLRRVRQFLDAERDSHE